jgi:hypothetical protein
MVSEVCARGAMASCIANNFDQRVFCGGQRMPTYVSGLRARRVSYLA